MDSTKKHKSRGVSLPPKMWIDAHRRATALDVSFSKYVQKLVALDLDRKLLKAIAA